MTDEQLLALALASISFAPSRACRRCGDAESGCPDPCVGGERHDYRDVPVPDEVAEARVVLLDALLEIGWWDERLYTVRWWPSLPGGEEKWRSRSRWLRTMSPDPERISTRARAVAAVLLLGEWPTSWPLAEECVGPRMLIGVDPAVGSDRSVAVCSDPVRFGLRIDTGDRMFRCEIEDAASSAWVTLNQEVFGLLDRATSEILLHGIGYEELPIIASMLRSVLHRRWPEIEFHVRALPLP